MPDLSGNPYLAMLQQDERPAGFPWGALANTLMGLGAGFSQAGAAGLPGTAGIGPGLMMGASMTGAQQNQAEARKFKLAELAMQESYRRAQEEKLRFEVEQAKRDAERDDQLMGMIPSMMQGGATASATPGFAIKPPSVQMGPSQFNVGNVRPVGSSTGFQQPASFDDGVALAVRNARAYPAAFNQGQPMTLLQIGERWAPKGDGANDPTQWARNVASIGGLPFDQPLDLNDPQIAARFARGVHGAEWGASMLKPPDAYVPGVGQAGSPRVIKVNDSGNPQVTPTAPASTVQPPRGDAMTFAPLLTSKKLAPYGKGMIDILNKDTDRYLSDQDREQRRIQFEAEQRLRELAAAREERNAVVGPDNKPNMPRIAAGTEAERQKMALEQVPAIDRATGQVRFVSKGDLASGQFIPLDAQKLALEAANAKVRPDMTPNTALSEAEAQTAAAKAEAEAKVKLKNDAALKLSEAEMARYSKDVRPGVEANQASLPNLYAMKRLTEGPLATGSFIDARQAGALLLDTLGIQPMSDGMVNRTEYNNRAGQNVLAFLQTRALGAGSGISEGDRKFVESLSGRGEFSPEQTKRLTNVAIDWVHQKIKQHNDDVVPRLQKLPGVGAIDKGYFDISAPTYDEWTKANPVGGTPPAQMTQMGSTYPPSLDPSSIMQNIAQPKDKAAYDALPKGSVYLHPKTHTFKVKP